MLLEDMMRVQHAKRHGEDATDPWEIGFFYGSAFALEERLYDTYHKVQAVIRSAEEERGIQVL